MTIVPKIGIVQNPTHGNTEYHLPVFDGKSISMETLEHIQSTPRKRFPGPISADILKRYPSGVIQTKTGHIAVASNELSEMFVAHGAKPIHRKRLVLRFYPVKR